VAEHIFQARPVWIYTQSNITNIIGISFRNHSSGKIFVRKKFLRKNFCDNAGTIRRSLANFFPPPPYFSPSRTPMYGTDKIGTRTTFLVLEPRLHYAQFLVRHG
jgi:hypothetical protein